MKRSKYIPLLSVTAGLLGACASIGRPEGGPRDTEPPVFVSSNPMPGSKNVKSNKISILFNENIQLDDPGNKIAVSPAQVQQPSISSNGRRITIELRDTLLPDATYTIDLSDAVADLNEGNVLDGFAIDFSTGNSIDSLMISGMVLQARNLEPAQGMLVGIYQTDADSAITTLRFDRIARTNQYGQFTLRNLPAGTSYQLFAINDVNRDLHWDRSEDVAFFGEMITPSVETVVAVDTLRNSAGTDSIVTREYRRYLPDDLLLTWFNEDYKPQYLKDYGRKERKIISLEMNAPVDSMPQLTIVGIGKQSTRVPLEQVSLLSYSAHGDTLNYWLTDSTIINADSLLVETTYRRVDTLDNLVWATDSLKFNFRVRGKKASTPVKVMSLQDKIDSIRAISDTIPIDTFALMQPTAFLDITAKSATQELNKPFYFSIPRPYGKIDFNGGFHLEMMPDSVWIPVDNAPAPELADSTWRMNFKLDHKWTPGMKYRLKVDSIAVIDPYGVYNKPTDLEFKARETEEYSTVIFNMAGLPDTVDSYIELLNSNDEVVVTSKVIGSTGRLEYLLPSTYYARLFIDADSDGKYTEGSMTLRRQPEEVYYFHKKLALKKNWDRTEEWNILELSPDLQKPLDIKKNKPRVKPGEDKKSNSDDEDEDDEYYDDGFGKNYFAK